MQILVKAAHSFTFCRLSRDLIRQNIIRCSDVVEPTLLVPALEKALELPREKVKYDPSITGIFDHIHDNRLMLQNYHKLVACTFHSALCESIRPSVNFCVEPTLTVGSLKSFLEREPWTPMENLMLVQNQVRPLDNDQSTLLDCGIRDMDTLLVCMGGSFELTISCMDREEEDFVIPVRSCLETVWELKVKIFQKTGYPLEDQELYLESRRLLNESSLVAEGIVKPYSGDMAKIIDLAVSCEN